MIGEGLVIDEWVRILPSSIPIKFDRKVLVVELSLHTLNQTLNSCLLKKIQKERREKYLARQQVEAVDSV